MVQRARALGGLSLAAAAAQAVVVVLVAVAYGHDGAASVVAAAVLGPIAVLATARIAGRLAGDTFARAAAWSFVLLPFVAVLFFLSTYRHTWLHRILPDLVGVRATPWFALGVALVVAAAFAPRHAAAAAGIVAAIVAVAVWGVGPLAGVRSGIHETGWSVALAEWLPVAGTIGAARRSPSLATALGGWTCFFVLHGAHEGYDAFWASLAPALPAAALLASSLALLLPRLRNQKSASPPEPAR